MRGNKKHQKTTSCIQDYDYGKPQTHSSYETLPPAIHKRPGPEHCSPALVPSNSKAWIHYCIFVHLYTIYICLWYVCTFCNMFEGRLSKPCYFALFGLWSPFDTIDSIGLLILETIAMEPLLPTAGEWDKKSLLLPNLAVDAGFHDHAQRRGRGESLGHMYMLGCMTKQMHEPATLLMGKPYLNLKSCTSVHLQSKHASSALK